MKAILFSLMLATVLVFQPVTALAFETDQYNLPPVPLADIGDEVSEYVEDKLRLAVAKVNTDIGKKLNCLEIKAKGCGSADDERKKLAWLRSNDAVAYEFFKLTGDGNVFTTKFGNWMRSHKFGCQPDRYKTSYGESIFFLNPTDYLTISPTVRLFGSEFGIDKLEHFFQQGYKYYTIEKESSANGKSPHEAAQKAIKWGQRTERTYYGLLASGVYSNADLYANYAGMKFFQGLTKPLEINDKTRPATLELKDGRWFVVATGEHLIKPFMTDHMNEALTPSAFRFTLVRSVRRAVKKHACSDWRTAYPELTKADMANRSKALEVWNGEDYGFTKKDRIVTIAGTCFDGNA